MVHDPSPYNPETSGTASKQCLIYSNLFQLVQLVQLFSTVQVILSTIVGTIALYMCGSLHLYRQLDKKNQAKARRSTEWRNGRRASTGLLRMDDEEEGEGEEDEEGGGEDREGNKKNGGGISPAVIGVGIGVVVYAVMFA